MDKTNHGPCFVCGRPILYLAARFCGPGCNSDFLANGARHQPVVLPGLAFGEEEQPEVEVEEEEEEQQQQQPMSAPEPSGFMSLASPPDEPPAKKRRIYF